MSTRDSRNQDELETVLQSYVETTSEPSPQTLKQWVHRYPQFERELTEFTLTWNLVNTLPANEVDQIDTQVLVQHGLGVLQDVLRQLELHQQAAPVQARPVVKSLLKEAAALGLGAAEFAKRLRMSVPLVTKLERRQMTPSSIPPQVVAVIAEVLQRTAASISDYFDNPPALAARASYKSKRAPAATRQDFFEAVHDDPELDPADRNYWASLEGE
jgi:hypothetical protein